jgi:GDP/UDP-N,N'-diacetylbacillosamine 2-epimerase (hydrolysing)
VVLLEALDDLKDTNIIFTMPNADPEGRIIKQLIEDYVSRNSDKAVVFTSMGQLRYLSAMKHVDAVVGNSSSGIVEAPGLKTATVDIGDRQRGRIRADSVIHCEPAKSDIAAALKKVFSEEFKATLPKIKNPFGEGNTSEQIIAILKRTRLEGFLKKSFYDIEFGL